MNLQFLFSFMSLYELNLQIKVPISLSAHFLSNGASVNKRVNFKILNNTKI